ncbi:hypothetical protein CXB51_031632 [Gossypium anomalum]|uniref:RING-type E3 ubiquitin transferase n=1 Tax=Gossypium anomalum TaxID=47600 RepID=A0A8J6CL64_9ROSI|nr:hypothetical protein CXB51_031632 [Gossypium anomalum]
MGIDMIKPIKGQFEEVPNHIRHDTRYWPHFKPFDFLALTNRRRSDGTVYSSTTKGRLVPSLQSFRPLYDHRRYSPRRRFLLRLDPLHLHPSLRRILPIATAAAASSAQRFRPSGLDPENLKIGKRALECAVCLSEFEDDEALRVILKCCHVFHLDCIDAWLAYHVTCPVCRAKLTPDSDDIALQVELGSNTTGSDNNNTESSHPTRQRVEQQNELVIHVDEETRPREKITGKFTRSHSTGHSMIQPGENTEREGSWKKGGEGSSRGKSNIDRRVFSRTPPFVSKKGPLKSPKGGGGDWDDGSHSWRGLTSVKEKLYCLNLKV